MNEEETRNRHIRPAILKAGWTDHQIREEYPYTMGRIHVSGRVAKRGDKKKVDFFLQMERVSYFMTVLGHLQQQRQRLLQKTFLLLMNFMIAISNGRVRRPQCVA